MLDANIRIIDSDQKIMRNILDGAAKEIKAIFQRAKAKIHADIINLMISALSKCPEIQSLKSGKLRMDFGLDTDPTEEIIYSIANSTYVYFRDFKFSQGSVKNVLSVYIQPDDFSNILNQEFAKVITEKGEELPWLQWLLLSGDAVVVTQYHVDYGAYESSRAGGAIMKPTGLFRVDPAFSGTADDNFITRCISQYEKEIFDIVKGAL
jgi:hypothetical protein